MLATSVDKDNVRIFDLGYQASFQTGLYSIVIATREKFRSAYDPKKLLDAKAVARGGGYRGG